MVRKNYVEEIFRKSLKPAKHGGINPYGGYGLADEEWDYLENLIENYDYSKVNEEVYEH